MGAHVSGVDRTGILDLSEWRRKQHREDWAIHLAQRQDEQTVAAVREPSNRSALGK